MRKSFSVSVTIRSDRTLISCYQFFQIRGTDMIRTEEIDADMYSNGVIYFGTVFMVIIVYDDVFDDQHRKVVHDKACKNFLYHASLSFLSGKR